MSKMNDEIEPHDASKFAYDLNKYLDDVTRDGSLPTVEEMLEDVARHVHKPEDYLAVNRWFRTCFHSHFDTGLYIQSLPQDRTQFNLYYPGEDRSRGKILANARIYSNFENAWRRHVGDEVFVTLEQSFLVFGDLMKLWFGDK